MKNVVMTSLLALVVVGVSSVWAGTPGVDYTFGEWATDTGLPLNATSATAQSVGITSLDGLTDYTNLQTIMVRYDSVSTIEADDFTGLDIYELRLDGNIITTIETGAFANMETLHRFYFNDMLTLQNNYLNWKGAHFRDLTFLTIKQLNVNTIDLSDSELSQGALDFMMDGGGSAFIGLAEHNGISEISFENANLSAITQFNRMHAMLNLQTLNLANVSFSPDVITGNYQEVVEMVNALELQGVLGFLTIDNTTYTARQSYFDDWDTIPLNELTVVPEPASICLLSFGALSLLRKRKS